MRDPKPARAAHALSHGARGSRLAAAVLGSLLGLAAVHAGCAATNGHAGQGAGGGGNGGSAGAGRGGGGAAGSILYGTSPACQSAATEQTSVGCDYYAVDLDALFSADNGCFVAFIANTSTTSALLTVDFGGTPIDLSQYAKIPTGTGKNLTYGPYDPSLGVIGGGVAILFLGGQYAMNPGDKPNPQAPVKCPVPAAIPHGAQFHGTGLGQAFHIQSDTPVVAYQMMPYGAGAAAVTGATLLLPTTAWDKTYVAVNAYSNTQMGFGAGPSMSLVAMEDDTTLAILPNVAIGAGIGVTGAVAGATTNYHLNKGQVLQITQGAELTGSPIQSDKPIGMWAGHQCADTPTAAQYCDHDEQQIPSIRSMSHEYVAVSHRQRTAKAESPPWRIVAAVDGTQLTYEPDVGGPTTLNLGEFTEFTTDQPFVVRSQDASHPFLVLGYMTGATSVATSSADQGYGDPDVVRMVPPAQYLSRYVFFTDSTYPETNLVVVRKAGKAGFADVTLDCAGALTGWTPVGTEGLYEYTRTDLVRHNFEPQGNCDNGRHEMKSPEPFGLWVWAWGGPETQGGMCDSSQPNFSCYVSYGYPAGEGLAVLNDVVFPPPK